MAACAICLSADGFSCDAQNVGGGNVRYDCSVCGEFIVTGSAGVGPLGSANSELTKVMRAVLSHRTRLARDRRVNSDDVPVINTVTIRGLLEECPRLPSPGQQATNAIRFVGEHVSNELESIKKLPAKFQAVIGAPNRRYADRTVRELINQGILTGTLTGEMQHPDAAINVDLSLLGWEGFEAERRGQISGSHGFMALKFNDAELDAFQRDVIKPAIRRLGYELEDMRDAAEAGIIDNVMRAKIRDAAFVLVDLTHGSPGAYWEAGYAEGLGKPVLYLCKQSVFDALGTHFDTNHCTTVKWSSEKADEFTDELVATLRRSLGLFNS